MGVQTKQAFIYKFVCFISAYRAQFTHNTLCRNERIEASAVSKPDYKAFLVDMVCTLPL